MDIHRRLYHYHKWATEIGFSIANGYTYEEASNTKSKQFIKHIDKWTERVVLFENLMKGAYKEVLGFID